MNAKDAIAISQQAVADKVIKIGIPCHEDAPASREWCWAHRVSPTHAKLDNCCFLRDGVRFGDVVEFREQGEEDGGSHEVLKLFVRVVSRGSTQCEFVYATNAEMRRKSPAIKRALTRRWRQISHSLEKLPEDVRPVALEGMTAGYGCAAFPASVTPAQAEAFVAACPFVVDQHADD
jgi:hypothetical protein